MTQRRRWSFLMPPLEHPPILWLDDLYRGVLTGSGRILLWGAIISCLSLLASGSYLIAVSLGFAVSGLVLSYVLGFCFRPPLEITVDRDRVPRAYADSLLHYRVEIRNRSEVHLKQVLVEERGLVPELRLASEAARIDDLPPGESRSAVLALNCRRRGIYRLEQLQITTSLPVGFTKVGRKFRNEKPLVVLPRPSGIDCQKILSAARFQESTAGQATPRGRSPELKSLRDWRSGDQIHDIHWRATARRGELICKEYVLQENRSCMLFLDVEARSASDEKQLDAIISIASDLVKEAPRCDCDLNVIYPEQLRAIRSSNADPAQISRKLNEIAGLESVRRIDFNAVIVKSFKNCRADCAVLLFTKVDGRRKKFVEELRGMGLRLAIVVDQSQRVPNTWSEDSFVEVCSWLH